VKQVRRTWCVERAWLANEWVKAWCPSEEGELKVQLSSDERPRE